MSRPSFVNSLLPHSRLLFPLIIRATCSAVSFPRSAWAKWEETRVEKHAHWRFIFNLPTRYLPDTKVSGSRFRTLQLFSYRYNVKCDDIPSSRSKAFVSTNENQPRFRYPGDYSLTVASSLISAVNTKRFRYYTHTHTHTLCFDQPLAA